jgi:hypothetical protein
MSMTFGPMVPLSTGNSIDLPVELSVSVIVPVFMLLPSIAPPPSLPAAMLRPEHKPPDRDYQTAVIFRKREMTAVAGVSL